MVALLIKRRLECDDIVTIRIIGDTERYSYMVLIVADFLKIVGDVKVNESNIM